MKSFIKNQNLISSENFLIKYVKTTRFENKYLEFSLNPESIKLAILKSPEFMANIDHAIEFLLKFHENDANSDLFSLNYTDSKLSFVSLQNNLMKFNTLAKSRVFHKNDQIDEDFSITKIEDNSNYFPESLIYTYSTLNMISQSCYDVNDKTNSVNKLIKLYRSYSIQSNFSPINPNLIKLSNEEMNDFNTLFIGIPLGSPIIHKNGIVSDGNFLFVLHSDMHLSIFPICNENGGFLSPFMCKLVFDSTSEVASLSLSSDNLIVSTNNSNYVINFSSIIKGQLETEIFEIKPKILIFKKEFLFAVSDGFVNVYVSKNNDSIIASVKLIDSEKEINQVVLQKNENDDLYRIFPFDSSLLKWPVETNGLVLSFYIKINNNSVLCRQFSLINGIHLKDEIIETNCNILSITYDSINQMHYVAIDNNGQLVIHALSSSFNCSLNPFIFGFSIPDFSVKKNLKTKLISLLKIGQKNEDEFKNEKEFIYLFSIFLLTSIFSKQDINTFIINEIESILSLPLLIIDIAKIVHQNNSKSDNKEFDKSNVLTNIQLASIQALSILFVINVKHQYSLINPKNQIFLKIESRICDLIIELSQINESFSMNIISFIIMNLFHLIYFFGIDNDIQSIILKLIIKSSSVLFKYMIHVFYMNSDKLSILSFSDDKNVFIKYIINNYHLVKCHPNVISFLLCHQRCLINQVHHSISRYQSSSCSFIINIKHDDCKTDNDALNNFSEYSNFLVNQLTNSISYFSSFEEIQKTTVYFLFTNFLSLITGLYDYNEVAQIVTPLLYISQCSIKELLERKTGDLLKNNEFQSLLINIGLAFGAFTGTMIKGGNYSDFDEKYKWLIRPNMNLISNPKLLNELDNPITDVVSFLDPSTQSYFSPSSPLNGKMILQNIYKKWNPSMNKNLSSALLDLDQLFLAVELYHLNLFDEFKEQNIEKLRPALNQMRTVRNKARSILQSNNKTRCIPIIDSANNNNDIINTKERINNDYSPFDLIVIKCKMLLRMKSKFDDSNFSNAPKLLSDFVLSPEKPKVFINYISNQSKRLHLTNLGFSLIEESYSLSIDESFLNIINTVLSIVVDNFDGLSSIIRYDSSHKSEKHVYDFLLKAFSNIDSPYLAPVVYKLIKSEVLPKEMIGKSFEKVLSKSITNNKLFGICYGRFGYISNLFTNSESFLFLDSETGKKVSLISLPEKEFNNINEKQWIIISDALLVQKCDPILYKKILNYFIKNDFHNNRFILQFVFRCIYLFYEKYDETYPLKNVKNDFHILLSSLAKSLDKNDNLERASEIITFFRRILSLNNEITLVLIDIFQSFETMYNQNKHINIFDYKEKLCAIFAILGGFIDIIKPNYPVSFRTDREKYEKGIFIDQNTIVKCPINEESYPINISQIDIFPEPLVPFNWCMYPNFNFITLFIYYATEEINSQLCLTYLNSLFYYLKEESFYGSLTDEHIEYLIERFSSIMNPFDNIKENQIIISYLLTHERVQPLQSCHFSVLSNNWCKSFLSPVIKKSQLNIVATFTQDFDGYFGLVADCPLEKQFPYAIIDAKNGTIYPGFIGARSKKIDSIKGSILRFSVDVVEQKIILNEDSNKTVIQIPQIANQVFKFRIFICVVKPCKIDSIKVKSVDLDQWNSIDLYDMSYKPEPTSDYSTNKMNKLIQFPSWMNFQPLNVLKNVLLDEGDDIFQPVVKNDFLDSPLFEMINFKDLLFHFYQAKTISEDYINSIINHLYAKLITQMSTIIMMYLVNNGFGKLIFSFKSSFLVKLFSYLLIPLEPYDQEKLPNNDFPFLFNESILNENSLVVFNQQFSNLEYDMKNCLQTILNLYENDTFIEALKSYIENMGNNPKVHTCRNINLKISFYDLVYAKSQISLSAQYKNSSALIVSTSYFNNFQFNSIESSSGRISFPFIYGLNNNSNASIQINISQFEQNKTISVLNIDKYSNHWVFGTSYELLLLLKEYYFISKDSLFIRKKLIEWILIDSPFIKIFLPKILFQISQDSFISFSELDSDYLKYLISLSSLINLYDQNFDKNLVVFLFQEKMSLNSNLQSEIAPFFPEFYSNAETKSESCNSQVTINLPDLNIPEEIKHPLNTFILCKSFITNRESIKGYPYWELLPIWLSISLKCCIKSDEYQENDDDIIIIKDPDGYFEVINYNNLNAFVYIDPSIRSQIQVNPDSFIITSNSSSFNNPNIIEGQNIFDPIKVEGEIFYLSTNYIEGPVEFIADIEKHKKEEPKIISYQFYPTSIHDEFVNEIKMLVNQWSEDLTSELLSIIHPSLLKQRVFRPISEIVLSSDISLKSYFPPRVILIVAYIIHRINFLHFSSRDFVSPNLWRSVNNLISFDESSEQFKKSIVTKTSTRKYLRINRFEAHRMTIEMNGNQANSIICQMSKILSNSPSSFQSSSIKSLWHVSFYNEDASDAGGPSRELFSEISKSIFEPTSGLFIPSPNGSTLEKGLPYRDVYIPFHSHLPHRSRVKEIDLIQRNICYKAIGVFLGIVMRTGVYQEIPFAPIVWKMIAGEKIVKKDVLEIDERLNDFFAKLQRAAKNKDKSIFEEQYNSRTNQLLWTCENWDGSLVKVENPTKSSSVRREDVNIYITNCIKKRIEILYASIVHIRNGMCQNIGLTRHQFMTGKIISFLCQGSNIITTDQLKEIFVFTPEVQLNIGPKGINDFWEAVDRMNNKQRSLLLKFITGLTRLPNSSDFQIKVHPLTDSINSLPEAHTCFNQFLIPIYTTSDIAFKMITIAIENCHTMEII